MPLTVLEEITYEYWKDNRNEKSIKQYMNGDIKARPIEEFWEERKIQELKSVCDGGDD